MKIETPRSLFFGFLFVAALIYSNISSLNAQTDQTRENDLKAYYVYMIATYVEWGNIEESDDFIIGVIGDQYILTPLVTISNTKKIKDKTFTVKQVTISDDLSNCSILFIAGSEDENINEIIQETKAQNILTFGDKAGYAEKGVNINILPSEGKLVFEVNLSTLDNKNIKISSKILKLAKKIY